MSSSKKGKYVEIIEKDDKTNERLINPKLYAIGIIIGFIIVIGCLLLEFGIGCAIFLILLLQSLILGMFIEIDAEKVYRKYLRYKKAYKNIETEEIEINDDSNNKNDKEFYDICKRNFNIFKIMTILTFVTVIVSYLLLSFSSTNLMIDNKIIGDLQNITTTAVVTLIGIALCYSNACYKKDFMQRYQFMCNNYRDLCKARKNRTNLYR